MTRNVQQLFDLQGKVALITGAASAQPYLINLSGATLLENFFSARASTVDFIDADGNGVFGVGIRGAQLDEDDRTARVFAGVGVVDGSDPAAELEEARSKAQAVLSALTRV